MSYIVCKKCNDSEIYLQYRGMQIGAYCSNCGAWQKWVGKKELPVYQKKGLRIHAEGETVTIKRDAPLGVIIENNEAKPSTFKSNVDSKDVPFAVTEEKLDEGMQEWEKEYAKRVQMETQKPVLNTQLSDEVEIERRVKARLIVERESLEEEIEKRVQERLKDYSPTKVSEQQGYCSLCEGSPLSPVQDKDDISKIDVSIYDGVLTVTNNEGTKLLGVYKIKRCPECGRVYETEGNLN